MSSTTVQEKKRGRTAVVAGLTPYAGTFGKEQLTHLLKRTMFGAKKADIDYFTGKPLTDVINELITVQPLPTNFALNYYNNASKTDGDIPIGETWVNSDNNVNNGLFNGERRNSLRAWWIGQMVNQNRSIQEKMVLFWHNHFATEMIDTTALYAHAGQMILRKNALGNFKTFVREVTFDPNMLIYLNGNRNVKTAPDENYGRELQELFTVGKGPNSKYTEDDVKAAAKILTGWNVRRAASPAGSTTNFVWDVYFSANNHDATNKTFSAFYNSTVVSGGTATEANARREIDELINMILATNEAAMYVCRRLYRFFVYYDIDATVEAEVIAPMAQIFRANNYEIIPVLKALLSSDHFFDVAQKACVIRSPMDFVIGSMREFNVEFPAATDYVYQYLAWLTLANEASVQGQLIGDPPNVAGWAAYYQEPVFHETWINTDTFPKRLKFIDKMLTTNGYALTTGKKLWIDTVKFTDQFGAEAGDPNKLVDAALALLYRVPPTAALKAYLKTTILLDGQASDHYWSDAWEAYKLAPTNATNLNIVQTRLQKFYRIIVDSPEYQLS